MKCSKCGFEFAEGIFCPECKTRNNLSEPIEEIVVDSGKDEDKQKKADNMQKIKNAKVKEKKKLSLPKIICIVIVGCLCLMLGSCAVACSVFLLSDTSEYSTPTNAEAKATSSPTPKQEIEEVEEDKETNGTADIFSNLENTDGDEKEFTPEEEIDDCWDEDGRVRVGAKGIRTDAFDNDAFSMEITKMGMCAETVYADPNKTAIVLYMDLELENLCGKQLTIGFDYSLYADGYQYQGVQDGIVYMGNNGWENLFLFNETVTLDAGRKTKFRLQTILPDEALNAANIEFGPYNDFTAWFQKDGNVVYPITSYGDSLKDDMATFGDSSAQNTSDIYTGVDFIDNDEMRWPSGLNACTIDEHRPGSPITSNKRTDEVSLGQYMLIRDRSNEIAEVTWGDNDKPHIIIYSIGGGSNFVDTDLTFELVGDMRNISAYYFETNGNKYWLCPYEGGMYLSSEDDTENEFMGFYEITEYYGG